MTAATGPITRQDIEARFRELNGEVAAEVGAARSALVTVVVGAAVVGLALAYLMGRRRGRTRSAVIEVRRL